MTAPAQDLVPRLASFGRLLRDAGLRVGPAQLTTAATALAEVPIEDPLAFRDALRATLVSRHEEMETFEIAFDLFWAPPDPRLGAATAPGRRGRLRLTDEAARRWLEALGKRAEAAPEQRVDPRGFGYSADELLREKDFGELTADEAEEVRRLIESQSWRLSERRTRRFKPSSRGLVDLRRSSRQAIHSSGELVHLLHRRPRLRRRPLVLLCDVSGSMERYTRMLLIFAHAVSRREDLETFVFSTRLTRITHELRQRDLDSVLGSIGDLVHDFSGGTRIGETLGAFNRRWARRVLGRGAVVVIVSDGWDRGDPHLLEAELSHLWRAARRLIWLNPLLGSEGYEPLTRGMAAAVPHLDDFLPVHNLKSLEELGRLLAELPARSRRSDATRAMRVT